MTASPPPQASGPRHQRKTFISYGRLQAYFVGVVLAFVVCAAVVVLGEYYYFYAHRAGAQAADWAVFGSFLASNRLLLAKLAAFAAGGVAVALFLSNRVAGPVYRLRKAFRRAADGGLDHHVRLRKGDLLQEAAAEFNDMLDGLAGRLGKFRTETEAAARDIEHFERDAPAGPERERLAGLRRRLQALARNIPG
jgi:nitrogen fixation/metabolism regulation signal transduction histidine kinase